MSKEENLKNILIENTISLISDGGFEKATTKEITYYNKNIDIKMNEVYIYRLFGSKENLYAAAFEHLDKIFFDGLTRAVNSVGGFEEDALERLYQSFTKTWNYLNRHEDYCRCYLRFYYSIYFSKDTRKKHYERFAKLIKIFEPVFRQGTDVPTLMHSVLVTLLEFVIRVYNNDIEYDDTHTQYVYRILHSMISMYMKDEIKTTKKDGIKNE